MRADAIEMRLEWPITNADGNEVMYDVGVYVDPPRAGKTQGDPNDCCAPEPPEADVYEIGILGERIPSRLWERHGFTDAEIEKIQDHAIEMAWGRDGER